MRSFEMRRGFIFAAMLGGMLIAGSAIAKERTAQPGSSTHGKQLNEWMMTWLRAAFDGNLGQDVGHVRLMELPDGNYAGGAGTTADPALFVGSMDVDMKTGEAFMVPVTTWYGERYDPLLTDGQHDDPVVPEEVFTDSRVLVTMDGQKLIDSDVDALADYYVGPDYFDPPIEYPGPTDYGSIATVYVQGLAFVHHPLTPGTHVMHLQSEIITAIPDYFAPDADLDLGVKFDNTWTIHVKE